MPVKEVKIKSLKVSEAWFCTHTSNYCQEIFARTYKPTIVLLDGGLTILASN